MLEQNSKSLLLKDLLYQILLVVLIFILFSFSLHYPIYKGWDDITYITQNPYLSFSFSNIITIFKEPYYCMYIPLTMLSYMLDHTIWGFNSFGYHLQNVFWHIVATIAIYNCFRFFKIKSLLTFLLCLIFACHSQRVESVVWLSERKDVLCTAFYLLSILFYLKTGLKNAKRNYFFSFIFFILALLAKPMAISLPFVLLLYKFYKHRTLKPKYFINLLPYLILLFIFMPLTYVNQVTGTIFSYWKQLYIILYNFKFYIESTFFPINVNPIYPNISINTSLLPTIIFYSALLLILIILFIKKKKNLTYNVVPILFCYIITLLPVIGIVPFSFCQHADRWSYIPSIFIWFAVGLLLTKVRLKKTTFIILIIYSIILIELNYHYQKVWEDRYTIFSYASTTYPANKIALSYMADLELGRKNYATVLKIADQLEHQNKGSLAALFFRAAVAYYIDKKSAIKQLSFIRPYYKLLGNKNYDSEFRYLKVLDWLIDSNYAVGNIQKAIEYTDEGLSYKHLTPEKRKKYLKVKDELLQHKTQKSNT